MTTLGIIFVAGYVVGFMVRGRLGILAVVAAAIPFNDSAAVIVSGIPISPFYLGILLYLPLAYVRFGLPRSSAGFPLALMFWASLVTVVGPTLFANMPVVASGVGLDQQVGDLAQLDYSSSNVAQIVYLAINIALLLSLSSSMEGVRWVPLVPSIVGTVVATTAWGFEILGLRWPDEVFQNNTRNAYAYVQTPRFAAFFSEPSHLGTFALVSAVLLTTTALLNRPRRFARTWTLLALACADMFLIVESASATALAGAAIFAMIATLWCVYRVITSQTRISASVALVTLATLGVIIVIAPRIWDLSQQIIDYKVSRGTSIRGRSSADLNSWSVFLDSGTAGVGLGSNRSSSLLLLLLSTIGLIGTTIFLLMMLQAVRNGLKDRSSIALAAALAALLIAELVSMADLVSPMMWLLAGYCWGIRLPTKEDSGPAVLVNTHSDRSRTDARQ